MGIDVSALQQLVMDNLETIAEVGGAVLSIIQLVRAYRAVREALGS
jgi:hypothetical protein